jgi:ABC-type proline/glycine betaine transport system permease subunit
MTYANEIILPIMDLLRAIHEMYKIVFDILLHILDEIQEREGKEKSYKDIHRLIIINYYLFGKPKRRKKLNLGINVMVYKHSIKYMEIWESITSKVTLLIYVKY